MSLTLGTHERELFALLVDYRVLTTGQVATLLQCSNRSARRRLAASAAARLIQVSQRTFGNGAGRPEGIVSFTAQGARLLREQGLLRDDATYQDVTAMKLRNIDHALLVNWFRIHLVHMERAIPRLVVRLFPSPAPVREQHSGNTPGSVRHTGVTGSAGSTVGFAPDGAFTITDKEQAKTVLFFLEVDMGTESLASPNDDSGSIHGKIRNYQAYFRSCQYKQYEELAGCPLKGFRLLFLANSWARLVSLCRVTRETPPSDFVWLTNHERMFECGLSAEIWVRGGLMDEPPESILGPRLTCLTPIPMNRS